MNKKVMRSVLFGFLVSEITFFSSQAFSQLEEIVVTARKREESLLDIPVTVTAFTGDQLVQSGVDSLTEISTLVPGLLVQENGAGFAGVIAMRGVSSGSSNPSIEQAVAVNIDGIQVSYGGVVKLGQLDLAQVEVLKGPQALFFGKNSTGGIIALKSANPGDEYESMLRIGYESTANEKVVEGMVSKPISDTLGVRFAARYLDQEGYLENNIPAGTPGVFGPSKTTGPGDEELTLRGTIQYTPSEDLTLRLKASYNTLDSNGGVGLQQRVFCNGGTANGPAAIANLDDCIASRSYAIGDISPVITARGGFGDGSPFRTLDQSLYIVDVEYQLSDEIDITSTSGLYNLKLEGRDEGSFGPISTFGLISDVDKTSITEEVRLNTDFSSPLNLMAGIYYQKDEFIDGARAAIIPFAFPALSSTIDTESFSAFTELRWDISEYLELSGGARYTHETKDISGSIAGIGDVSANMTPDKVAFDNVSPELTLAWRPNDDIMLFTAYKEGFKSGGFQVNFTSVPGALAAGVPIDLTYQEETVDGFEAGVKASLLDGDLRANFTLYRFEYNDLQLSLFDPTTSNTSISNIGGSIAKGVEFDMAFAPHQIEGLSLYGSLNYGTSEYVSIQAGCYVGQTLSDGCNIDQSGDGVGDLQDLSGTTLPKAPLWTGNIGGSYESNLGDSGLRFRFSASANYTDELLMFQEAAPNAIAEELWAIDASVSIASEEGSWELALIGRNLTDEIRANHGAQVANTGDPTTTGTAGPGVVSDIFGNVTRPVEYWLQLTVWPSAF